MQTSTAISRLAAATLADNGAAKDRHPLAAPLTKRFDAILHVIEVVLRDMLNADPATRVALARLTEALARILDLPPQPQESLRDFTRRLAAHMDTLPPAARTLIEKQLNQQSLLSALKILVETLRPGIVIDLNLDLPGLRDRILLGAPSPDIFDTDDRSAYHRPTIQVPLPTRMAFPQAPGVAPGAPHLQKALGQAFSPEASLPGKATPPGTIPDVDDTMPAFREAAAFLAHDGEALAQAVSIALGRSAAPSLHEASFLMPLLAETAEQRPETAFTALADEHPAGGEASPGLHAAAFSSETWAGELAETAPPPTFPLEHFETLDTRTDPQAGPNRTVPPDPAELVPTRHGEGHAESRPRLAPPAAVLAAAPAFQHLPPETRALPLEPASRTVQAPDGAYQAEAEGSWARSPNDMDDSAASARPSAMGGACDEASAGRANADSSGKKDAAVRGDGTAPGGMLEAEEKRARAGMPAVLLAAATAGLQEMAVPSGQIDEWETLFYMLSGSLGESVEEHPAVPARPSTQEQATGSVRTKPSSEAEATAKLLVADDEQALHHRASLSNRAEDSLTPVNPGRGLESALIREALGYAFVPYLPVDTPDHTSDDDEEPRRHAGGKDAGSDGNDERQGDRDRQSGTDGGAAREDEVASDNTDSEHHDAYELYQRLSDLS